MWRWPIACTPDQRAHTRGRRYAMIRLFVLAMILTSVTSAAAQVRIAPENPLGTYDLGWAATISYTSPQFVSGAATVEVTALTPNDPLVDPSWLFGGRCWAWTSGRFECRSL